MFKHFSKIYNALEINKSTKDVEEDLKYSCTKGLILHKAFYFVGITLGVVVLSFTWDKIANSHFRQELIKNGTMPFFSLFKNDYEGENKDITKIIEEYRKKIGELDAQIKDKSFDKSSSMFLSSVDENKPYGKVYPYAQFLQDYKEGKITSFNLKDFVYKDASFQNILSYYVVAYLVQHKDDTIELNGNPFAISVIGQKLNSITDVETRKQGAKQPLDKIMTMLKIEDHETTRDLVLNALCGLEMSARTANYRTFDVSNISEAWAKLHLLSGFPLSNSADNVLRSIYTKNFNELSSKANEEFEALKKQRADVEEAKKTLLNKINLGQQAQRTIQALQTDVKNYDKNKDIVEQALDTFKKETK